MTEQQVQARTRRKPRSLAQELVTVLTERIRSGQLKRGDKLPVSYTHLTLPTTPYV